MFAKVIYTLLDDNAAYKALCGTDSSGKLKLYPASTVPQGIRRPYAAYTFVSRVEQQDKTGRGIYTVNVQIDHYANTVDDAEAMDHTAITALNRYKGTVSGVKVKSIRVQGGNDGYNENQEASHRLTEFSIKIQG